ncbi:MAG: PAC2 family protein [Pirellulaceae bacterium]
MSQAQSLTKPWLVAVWPGMGNVAISAGFYLMAKLEMHLFAEFSARELFDLNHVEVKGGLIRPGDLPRSRCFVWKDPWKKRDIVVFIGEAQPPTGKYALCRRIVQFAEELGVERLFTFAAMATQMHPTHDSRVFGATTDEDSLAELRQLELQLLEDGHIGGLNGVLLGAVAESGLRGTCLLGEMPHLFAQLPFPKASLAVLEVFKTIADIELDLTELSEQAREMEQQLGKLLAQIEQAIEQQQQAQQEAENPYGVQPAEEERMSPQDEQRIEQLFQQAEQDRSKAYELKRELDRLDVFSEYEDRFLDIFKNPESKEES